MMISTTAIYGITATSTLGSTATTKDKGYSGLRQQIKVWQRNHWAPSLSQHEAKELVAIQCEERHSGSSLRAVGTFKNLEK